MNKRVFAAAICVAALAAASLHAEKKVKVFVAFRNSTPPPGDKRATDGLQSLFVNYFDNALKTEFPCAHAESLSDIGAILGVDRIRSLLGVPSDQLSNVRIPEGTDVEDMAAQLGDEIAVTFEVRQIGPSLELGAMAVHLKREDRLSRHAKAAFGVPGVHGADATKELAEDLARSIGYFEPCAYKGPFTISVHSVQKKDDKQAYQKFCNGGDQPYRKTTKLLHTLDTEGTLVKTGWNSATGDVAHHDLMDFQESEEDGCYACPSGRQGGHTTNKVLKYDGRLNALSKKSKSEGEDEDYDGKEIKDARISIFFHSDEYFITVKATTEDATAKAEFADIAEGTCDVHHDGPKTIDRTISAPLYHKFGPFKGTPLDKVLKGDLEDKIPGADGEQTVMRIRFQLSRQ